MKLKSMIQNIIGMFILLGAVCLVLHGLEGENKERFQEKMMSFLYPFCDYADGGDVKGYQESMIDTMCFWYLGLGKYMEEYPVYLVKSEDDEMFEWILLQEARDEGELAAKNPEGRAQDGISGNQTVSGDVYDGVAEENGEKMAELVLAENQRIADARRSTTVWESDMERTVFLESLKDFETLKREFYHIDKNTNINASKLDAQKMLAKDMSIKTPSDEPQILIYHTHSQEAFADSAAGDKSTTIVGAGERLAELLRGYGYNVIHHTGEYDVENRDYAYSNAAPAIEQLLKENPSIEVIIDLHRDGVGEDTRLVTEIDGVKMAQFMFFNGLSYTNVTGDIEYLKNPYIEDNLALSFQLQLAATEYYPGLARKIYLKGYRYNMHYRPKSILLELGAQTNTVEEIMNALPPIAHILDEVLSQKESQ